MRCSTCNREIDEAAGNCPHCAESEGQGVRVLSPEERTGYDGVTIDTGGEPEETREAHRSYYQNGPRQKIYVKSIGLGSSNWLMKFIIFAAVAAIAAFLILVALPMTLLGIAVGVVVWLVLSLFRG